MGDKYFLISGPKLVALRVERLGMHQDEFGKLLGMSGRNIGRVEQQPVARLYLKRLEPLAGLLKMSRDEVRKLLAPDDGGDRLALDFPADQVLLFKHLVRQKRWNADRLFAEWVDGLRRAVRKLGHDENSGPAVAGTPPVPTVPPVPQGEAQETPAGEGQTDNRSRKKRRK